MSACVEIKPLRTDRKIRWAKLTALEVKPAQVKAAYKKEDAKLVMR